MLTVACVLRKSSNISFYNETWVQKLKRGVERNLTIPYKFVCLTNIPSIDGIETKPLTESWPNWWSKIELFKPNQFEDKVLYIDLDVMICGNIDKLVSGKWAEWEGLMMLQDSPLFPDVYNSGLMCWDVIKMPYLQNIFTDFKSNPMFTMMYYAPGANGVQNFGDQGFIRKTLSGIPKHEQATLNRYLDDNSRSNLAMWQRMLNPDWFLPFSYGDRFHPDLQKYEHDDHDVRIAYCLGHPKFSAVPNSRFVQRHWV